MELTHTQSVHRLKDIKDELERLQNKADDKGLTPEDEEYWADLVRESGEVDGHRKSLERKAEYERVKIISAHGPRNDLRVERGSDNGELDRDILDPDSI